MNNNNNNKKLKNAENTKLILFKIFLMQFFIKVV